MLRLTLLPFAAVLALCSSVVAQAATPSAATPSIRVDHPYAMTVRILDEAAGKYEVEVENENPTKFVSRFSWTPPSGLAITQITSSTGGRCLLTGDGIVTCVGLAAPAGSVTTMGGSIVVRFNATGLEPTWAGSYWIHHGVLGSVKVTQSTFTDLPLCKTGQKSTAARPCAKA
jgi:hypothetical protein